jgi:hypothetical protein
MECRYSALKGTGSEGYREYMMVWLLRMYMYGALDARLSKVIGYQRIRWTHVCIVAHASSDERPIVVLLEERESVVKGRLLGILVVVHIEQVIKIVRHHATHEVVGIRSVIACGSVVCRVIVCLFSFRDRFGLGGWLCSWWS